MSSDPSIDAGAPDLGWTLGVVFRAYVKAAETVTADLPGGPRGRQVLAAAAYDEPGSQSALAHQLGIDRTIMTYLLDDLVAADLVARQPDPHDRRNRRVVATEHGRSVLAEIDGRLRLAEEHVLSGLDAADRTALRSLLERLAGRLNRSDPLHDTCAVIEDLGARHEGVVDHQS